MQGCSSIGRTFNYTPFCEASNYPQKEQVSSTMNQNNTINPQSRAYDHQYQQPPLAQSSAPRSTSFRLPSFASLISTTDPTYSSMCRLPSVNPPTFTDHSTLFALKYSTITPRQPDTETDSVRPINKKPRRTRKPKFLSHVLNGKWPSSRKPSHGDGQHKRHTSSTFSAASSTMLVKPRWQDTERLDLFKAIVKEKQLDDMASFSWDRISLMVGRAKKACKDQWRREVLPALMERLK